MFVQGAARAEASNRAAQAAGFDDADWWQAHQPYWNRLLDRDRYPLPRMFDDASCSDPGDDQDFAFEFGWSGSSTASTRGSGEVRRAIEGRLRP